MYILFLYNRQPVPPVNIQYNLNTTNDADEVEYPFNKETLGTMLSLRQKAHQKAGENMKAQKKQQRDYKWHHTLPTSFKVKDKVS